MNHDPNESIRMDSPRVRGDVDVSEYGEWVLVPDTIPAPRCQVAGEVTPECQEPISSARVDRLEEEAEMWSQEHYRHAAHGVRITAKLCYMAGARAALAREHAVRGGVMGEVVPTVPNGCIIDDKGQVLRVLGELPMTADGCVIGHGGTTWFYDSSGDLVEFTYELGWVGTGPRGEFSTPQAAAAGKGGRDGR